MLGFGESREEVIKAIRDLKNPAEIFCLRPAAILCLAYSEEFIARNIESYRQKPWNWV